MKRFVVLHQHDVWVLAGEYDTIEEAVESCENELRNMGGGVVEIFEWWDPLVAYSTVLKSRQVHSTSARE